MLGVKSSWPALRRDILVGMAFCTFHVWLNVRLELVRFLDRGQSDVVISSVGSACSIVLLFFHLLVFRDEVPVRREALLLTALLIMI